MEENKIKVYVKIDNNVITEIASSIQDIDFSTKWIQIDEGQGDKYRHAQGNYFDKPLMDKTGKYNYKLMDSKGVELTEEEKDKLFSASKQVLSLVDRIAMLENLQLQQGGLV